MQMILSLVQTPLQVYFTPTAAPDSLPLAKCEILKDGSVLEIQGLGQRRKKTGNDVHVLRFSWLVTP